MSHDELIEQFAREHRYRGVLVAAAVIGILASAVVGIAFTVGGLDVTRSSNERAALGLFVLPFAVSMVIGSGVYKALLHSNRRRPRRATPRRA
jgi:high-affinity Fe2+/Pb2+ permease